MTCANIPGPDVSLYLAGAQLLEVFPMVPLMGTVALGVGAMSYAGQFTIMAVADRDACPISTSSPQVSGTSCEH